MLAELVHWFFGLITLTVNMPGVLVEIFVTDPPGTPGPVHAYVSPGTLEVAVRFTVVMLQSSVFADIRNYCKPALSLCHFDEEKCAVGITHLDNYRKKWDKIASMFTENPLHDEASHGADAYRTAAVALKTGLLKPKSGPVENKSPGLTSLKKFSKKNTGLVSRR